MDTSKRSTSIERNPETHARYRREAFWQISLPLLVGILLILAALGAIIFSAVQPVTELGRWSDVSLMWLILPSLFFAFIFLVILFGFIYAFSRLMGAVPRYAYRFQRFIDSGKHKIIRLTDLMAEPVLRIHSFSAAVRQLRHIVNKSIH